MRGLAVVLFAQIACSSPPSRVIDAAVNSDAAAIVDGGLLDDSAIDDIDADMTIDEDAGPPDMTVYAPRTKVDLAIEERNFDALACELTPEEDCVAEPGLRSLLRFSVETPNIGESDILLGSPSADNDSFQYSPCHEHYHLVGYAEYRLLDDKGAEVGSGHKQAFCVVDTRPFLPGVPAFPKYTCFYQGLQAGWSDVYDSRLPCQFVDITDVEPGQYTLEVKVNAAGVLVEANEANNVVTVPVDLTQASLLTPTEACDPGDPPKATDNQSRECGWTQNETFDCTPGGLYQIGCCDCTGDPMMRICDPDVSGGNCSFGAALATGDNSCNGRCPDRAGVTCPASGKFDTYLAPKAVGGSHTCTLTIMSN